LPDPVPGFAVIELFTSEGCSSCPGADRFLNALTHEVRARRLPVYTLAFHVDYWDRLKTRHGVWADPFSSPTCTKRQTAYAKAPTARRKGVRYTPQFLINGVTPSKLSADGFRQLLKRHLSAKPSVRLSIEAEWKQGKVLTRYSVGDAPASAMLVLAVVERGLTSKVTAGENVGKTLAHENVVRIFAELDIGKRASGIHSLRLPSGLRVGNASLVAFVQERPGMAVVAARQVGLSPPESGAGK
jgi:hypothetical protein